ncbi:hypothetical protein DCC62_25910 [candidate division KSB1 bacterium]|nr:MAG: hypothetical protein DCC62_25910 [candidate division KSB1 bacterium]
MNARSRTICRSQREHLRRSVPGIYRYFREKTQKNVRIVAAVRLYLAAIRKCSSLDAAEAFMVATRFMNSKIGNATARPLQEHII